jgi:hypothetical protein
LAKSIAKQLGTSCEWVGSIIHEDLDMLKLSAKRVPKCRISNALDGSEDDILYEESNVSSENNREDDFSGSGGDFLGFCDY